ncbi:MAG: inositol monophosphatase [Gemmatales bacterium]|nr:inositol monophosphatase [Gemmatales bacterium]MDW8387098.1 inositol monophosphatase family protein [Gemmatales bacterium]
MDQVFLQKCLHTAQQAARRGAEVLDAWRRRISVREKGRFDLVTEADLASQEAIRQTLAREFPDFAFLGEEGGSVGQAGQPTWIVDPLDGTTNYVHQVPFYAVSIALAVEGEILVGVILDPCRNEMFHGARGMGAWLGSDPLRTTNADSLEEALISTGFPPDLRGKEYVLESWRKLSLKARSLRRTGSTALNLAYVAAGRNDGFWTHHAFAWDCAAGALLVREAGGVVSHLDGTPYDLHRCEIVSSNGPLHPALLAELAS